jgi:hypothetical protein
VSKTLYGLGLAVALLAIALVLRGREESPSNLKATAAAAGSLARGAAPADVVLAIRPGTRSPSRPATPAPKLSPLMVEFANKAGRKALHDRLASKARTPEEDYVMAEILNACRGLTRAKGVSIEPFRVQARDRLRASLSPKDPTVDKRLAALERMMESPCDGFEGVPIDPGAIQALFEKAAAAGDPRAKARLVERDMRRQSINEELKDGEMRVLQPASLSDEQLAALRQAAASGDPAAIASVGRVLASTMANLVVRTASDERHVDQRAFHDAWNLVACDAGDDCGPAHFDLTQACLGNGYCDAIDLEEHLFFYANSPQQSQLVAQYRAEITRAIRSGDWSFFQFHRGPANTYTGGYYVRP